MTATAHHRDLQRHDDEDELGLQTAALFAALQRQTGEAGVGGDSNRPLETAMRGTSGELSDSALDLVAAPIEPSRGFS